MPNHVFGDVNSGELFAVVDIEGETNELRSDGGASGPGLDWFFGSAGCIRLLDFLEKVIVDEEAFLDGACHGESV